MFQRLVPNPCIIMLYHHVLSNMYQVLCLLSLRDVLIPYIYIESSKLCNSSEQIVVRFLLQSAPPPHTHTTYTTLPAHPSHHPPHTHTPKPYPTPSHRTLFGPACDHKVNLAKACRLFRHVLRDCGHSGHRRLHVLPESAAELSKEVLLESAGAAQAGLSTGSGSSAAAAGGGGGVAIVRGTTATVTMWRTSGRGSREVA